MGVWVQDTYATYGASWKENLFYSHFLSLPLFLPLWPTLHRQYGRLSTTQALGNSYLGRQLKPYVLNLGSDGLGKVVQNLPVGLALVGVNALTQLACISGVNVLSANASAVTVTIVLNIRKLVSFVFSTWIFGHQLGGLMMLGAGIVFGSGALYGWETSWRLPQKRKAEEKRDGLTSEKKKS